MSSGWKAIYDRACCMLADKDVVNMCIKDEELVYISAHFDDRDIEALLIDIIDEYKEESK